MDKKQLAGLINALNYIDELAQLGAEDNYEESLKLEKAYNKIFNFINKQ